MARQPQLGLSMSGKEEKNGVSGGRLVRALDGWLDRLEAKACKKYDKWSAKTNKIKSRAANLSSALSAVPGEITVPPAGGKQRKRDRLRRAWDLATSSRTSIACSIILLGFAVPGAVMAVGATLSVMTFVFLLVQILLITLAPAGMLLIAGGTLFQPLLLNIGSATLTAVTLVAALLLHFAPRLRKMPGLTVGTVLPLLNVWLASLPVHSFEVVKSMRVFDPLAPMLNDPLFRPMLPDLFLSDFLDLVPNPFLLRGPTVFIESSGPAPFFALKATVSLAAIAVAAFYWYQERAAIAKQLRPLLPAGLGSGDSAVQASGVADSTYEELRVDMAKEDLDRWESNFKIRPQPSAIPAEWSVDDLCYMLETKGLGECCDSMRRAGIDGRVALTLSARDEDDIRNDLGVNKLGTRRRLLLYFDELRNLQDAADEKE